MPHIVLAVARPAELFDLSGRSAVITGGGTGIGRQMALGLAEAGADVFICARNVERCEEAAAEIAEETGVRTFGFACDMRDPDSIAAAAAAAEERLGKVDILVNNSGTTWGAAPEDVDLESWRKVLDVNVTGSFLMAQALGRGMIAAGSGKIINLASLMATRGALAREINAIAYNTSKGAVVTFTKDLAAKWAPYGVQVNAIAPGWFPSIMTDRVLVDHEEIFLDRIPAGRLGGPDDLKGAVVFLSSAASDFVTGQLLGVDGGQSAI